MVKLVAEALDGSLRVVDVVFVGVQLGLAWQTLLLGVLERGFDLAQALLEFCSSPPSDRSRASDRHE